jgi:transposase
MQVIHERCAGLDIHKKLVVVTVLITHANGQVQKFTRTFATMLAELLALADWLDSLQVVQIAMESTGVFWHPVYHVLEDGRTLLLVNPQHIKALPGRKTDVKDSEWIADLFRHG